MSASASRPLEGVQVYRAGALLGYFVLGGVPVGLIFYGLNVKRRGERVWGATLSGFGAVMLVGLAVSAISGNPFRGLGIWGLLAGIVLYPVEQSRFSRSLAAGATPAKWWPPVLLVLGYNLTVGVASQILFPSEVP